MSNWDTPAYYRFFAGEAARGGSLLYEVLSLGIAEDDWLRELAAHRRPEQPPANVLFAAVHYLLLSGVDDPLRAWYPSVGGERPADGLAVAAFRRFCEQHRSRLLPLIVQGVTNTNEVGRSALLLPAFSLMARETHRPLSLIELGPSAGLNLNFDRYGYHYTDVTGEARIARWTDKPLVLTCQLRNAASVEPPTSTWPEIDDVPPTVCSRIGLEQSSVDPSAVHDHRWLRALVWPERTDRMARLDAALDIAQDHPPPVRAGDALALLPAALSDEPSDAEICVYHTMVTYQFSRSMRDELASILHDCARQRPVWRIAVEWEHDAGGYPLQISRLASGAEETRTLARCDPHGSWLEWY